MSNVVNLPAPPVPADKLEARRRRAQASVEEMLNANNGGYSSAKVFDAVNYLDDRLNEDQIVALFNEFIAPRINNILRCRGRTNFLRRVDARDA
jgi:hypothetical protein